MIVFTNGCFDVLHVGHVRFLKYCRSLVGPNGELVVGMNSDDSVRGLKGKDRPLNSYQDRMEILSALDPVDRVVEIKSEEHLLWTIERIKPSYLVKDESYDGKHVVGRDSLGNWGGKMVYAPFLDGKSTSAVLAVIKSRL